MVDVDLQHKPDLPSMPFEFRGTASEYFSIWIVNLFLTLVTLGVYSAWAKVRRRRYFYSSTLLDHSPFEYHADPVKILKGRAILFSLLATYLIFFYFMTPILPILLLLAFFAAPWLLIRSRSFNLYNSSWRNIRFSFTARYKQAFNIHWIFVLLFLVVYGGLGERYVVLTAVGSVVFLCLIPAFFARHYWFTYNYSTYGMSPFGLRVKMRRFYGIYFRASLLFVLVFLLLIVMVVVAMPLLVAIPEPGSASGRSPSMLGSLIPLIAVYLVAVFPMLYFRAYLTASVANLVWGSATCGEHRLQSTMQSSKLFGLYLVNALGIIFSVGFLIPWAKIRVIQYRFDNLRLLPGGDMDEFIASLQEQTTALGEEVADFLDFDIGL